MFRQAQVSSLLYKIWYKVLLDGTSAGCILSCISVCGVVATIAVEMGIPAENISKSLDVSVGDGNTGAENISKSLDVSVGDGNTGAENISKSLDVCGGREYLLKTSLNL